MLSSGQTIEIITTQLGRPNASWLEFVVTAKARTNIKNYLKSIKSEQALDLGLRILDKALHDYGTSFTEIPYASIKRLLKEYNLKDEKELFIGIGLGNIVPHLAAQNIAIKKIALCTSSISFFKIAFIASSDSSRLILLLSSGPVAMR